MPKPPRPTGSTGTGLYPDAYRKQIAQEARMSPETVSRILNGRQGCRAEVAARIARALGISLERFIRDLGTIRDGRIGNE